MSKWTFKSIFEDPRYLAPKAALDGLEQAQRDIEADISSGSTVRETKQKRSQAVIQAVDRMTAEGATELPEIPDEADTSRREELNRLFRRLRDVRDDAVPRAKHNLYRVVLPAISREVTSRLVNPHNELIRKAAAKLAEYELARAELQSLYDGLHAAGYIGGEYTASEIRANPLPAIDTQRWFKIAVENGLLTKHEALSFGMEK
jgi:hypothetical protein